MRGLHHLQPIGIHTIPQISFIGRSEDELTASHVPFEVGVSRYRELARGQIIGVATGHRYEATCLDYVAYDL